MSERAFTIAFSISLGFHLILLLVQLAPLNWLRMTRHRGPLEVIYDYQVAQQELRHLQDELARAKRETLTAPSPTSTGGIPAGAALQIRIPDRPILATTSHLPDAIPSPSSSVDLTNLTEASHGEPVLLSYFSAIREQIQHTANRRGWLADEAAKGLVYVSFVLNANGSIRDAAIITERSVSSPTLQGVALRIVETASPFPPFPPSIAEARKTIVVPLEFLLES